MEHADELIPENEKGIETNTESSIELASEAEANEFYGRVKQRLLDINHWHDFAGTATADFRVTDGKGNEVNRPPRKGDFFKITIPGPGTITGEGHDWVQVEAIEENENEIAIRVRPASNPLNEREDIAHFFSDEATSSFVVKKDNNKVTAAVYGRNEKPNLDTEKVVDKLRNAAVATGAVSGFSKLQWKSLVNGLIKK